MTIEKGSDIAIVWLIPITTEEARFIQSRGWKAFEEALDDQAPDLIDVN